MPTLLPADAAVLHYLGSVNIIGGRAINQSEVDFPINY